MEILGNYEQKFVSGKQGAMHTLSKRQNERDRRHEMREMGTRWEMGSGKRRKADE